MRSVVNQSMKLYTWLLAALLFFASCQKKSSIVGAVVPQHPLANAASINQLPIQHVLLYPYYDTFYGTLRHTMMYPITFADTLITMYIMHPTANSVRFSNMVTDQNPIGVYYSNAVAVNDSGNYLTFLNSYYKIRGDSIFYSVTYEHCPDYDIWDYSGKRINTHTR